MLDEKLSTYPFMFPELIYNYWLNNIRKEEPGLILGERSITIFAIPLEFVTMINDEYAKKVKNFNDLTK